MERTLFISAEELLDTILWRFSPQARGLWGQWCKSLITAVNQPAPSCLMVPRNGIQVVQVPPKDISSKQVPVPLNNKLIVCKRSHSRLQEKVKKKEKKPR